jgi:uncharacterized repeat protein (TIGR01451 family)
MKLIYKSLILICLLVVSFFVMNREAWAGVSYKSELVDYSESFGVKQYTYDLYVEITGTSKVNHFEGKLKLTNLDLLNFKANSNFVSSFNNNSLEYNLTSNKVYTANDGKLIYATVTVKSVDSALQCKFEYEPYTYKLVPTNTFSIIKSAYKDNVQIRSVKAGEEFQYKIVVKSANNAIATDNVVVTDTIPSELRILSVSNGGSITGQKITWNLGNFSPGEKEMILTVNVKAKEDSKGLVNNIAILTVGDNKFQDEEAVDILYSQITIDKKVSRSQVTKGEEFYYTIHVKNVGTGTSNNVIIEDNLDSDLEFISSSVPNTMMGRKLLFDIGTLEPNQTKTIKINVKALETTKKETILNTAIAHEDGKDPVQDSEEVKIIEKVILPDISISKRASLSEAKPGEEFYYIITVKNNNELNLIDLIINDTLDSNLEFISSEDEVSLDGNTIKWIFDLKGNETKEFIFIVKVKDNPTTNKVFNQAIITFEDKDIPSEEIEIPIIVPEDPPVEPNEPADDPNLPDNPSTGSALSILGISCAILLIVGIINYVRKNSKLYKI